MEPGKLDIGLHISATQGLMLTLLEKASLDLALSALMKHGDCETDLFFWGKILGKENDYYIAYVTQEDENLWPAKRFFYSTNVYKFRELRPLSVDDARKFDLIQNVNLTGDPTWVSDTSKDDGGDTEVTDGVDSEKDAEVESTSHKLTELQRLSGLVKRIDDATAVVPRGAYALKNGRRVTPAPEFKVQMLRRLAAEDYQFHAEFFDNLQSDVPKGSWIIRHDPATGAVTVRSLLWPGYVAYCVLNTTNFGSVYIGTGEQNLDLPFLLP